MTGTRYTILFVDDEPGLSAPLRLSLEARGYVCVSKTNMTEGWTFLEQGEVNVLVTDIMMPGGDAFPDVDSSSAGFHFVRKVREAFPSIAIICLSVIADTDRISELKKRDIFYLRKGETPLETARRLIESKATGRASY